MPPSNNNEQANPDQKVEDALLAGDPLIGTTIADRYNISSVIGFGGWSVVYRAFDGALNRSVAIKAMHQHLCVDQSKLLRFQREAQASSGLTHQNIAVVYDCGLLWAGRPYISMELVEGRSLAEMIKEQGALDVEKSISIFKQICEGLEAVHQLGLVHRDLKPSNIKVSENELVKVLDFGCAKWLLQDQNLLTRSDESIGTPAYMSPEQCMGKAVDSRSDIYALGCLMYEVLTGIRPFASDNLLECMRMHLKVTPANFRTARPDLKIPGALEAVVFKALSKEPEDRFTSAKQLREALATSLREHSLAAIMAGPWRRMGARRRRRLTIISIIILFVGLIGIWFTVQSLKSRAIVFPEGHEVGSLYLVERDGKNQDVSRNKFGPAQGIVHVPISSYVQLAEVPETDASTLSFLQRMKPDDLQRLDLSGATLANQAIENINLISSLDSLSLNSASISDDALVHLKLPQLVGLNLAGTSVTDKSLYAVAVNCPRLHWIQLRGNARVTDAGLSKLGDLADIGALMFQDVPNLSGSSLRALAASKTLSVLVLRGDNVTDIDLKSLVTAPNLRRIDLSATHITDNGILTLSRMSQLRNLNVSETQITDKSVPAISLMTGLKSLNVSSTRISSGGIQQLRAALNGCEIKSNE
jgi:serine/threonine protein kinase